MFVSKETAVHVTAVLNHADEGGYVAYNLETGSTTQGETIEQALANLREAVEIYLEEFENGPGPGPCEDVARNR